MKTFTFAHPTRRGLYLSTIIDENGGHFYRELVDTCLRLADIWRVRALSIIIYRNDDEFDL